MFKEQICEYYIPKDGSHKGFIVKKKEKMKNYTIKELQLLLETYIDLLEKTDYHVFIKDKIKKIEYEIQLRTPTII